MESHVEKNKVDTDEIIRLYNSGLKQHEIVKEIGCAKSTVKKII